MKDSTTSKMRVPSKRTMRAMSTHCRVISTCSRTLPACSRTLPACSRTTICHMSVIVFLLTSLSLVPVSNAITSTWQPEDIIADDSTTAVTDTSPAYPAPSFTPEVGVVANSGETNLFYSANLPNLSQTSAETASNTETVLRPSESSVSFTISSSAFKLPMLDTLPSSSLTSVVEIVQSFFSISATSLQSTSLSTMTPLQIKPPEGNFILSSSSLEVASTQLTSEATSVDAQVTISLQTQPPQLPTEPPQLPTEPPQLPTEPPQLPTESPQLRTESPQLPTESPQLPTESPQLPTESPQLPTESPQLPTESPQLPTESPQLLTESPQIPTATPQLPTESPQLSPSQAVASPYTPSSPQTLTAMNPSEMLTSTPSQGTLMSESMLSLNLVESASFSVTSVLELSTTKPEPPSPFLDVSAVVSPDLISQTTAPQNPTYNELNSASWTAVSASESSVVLLDSVRAHTSTEETALLHDSYTLGLLETDSPITVDLITSLTDSSDDIDLPNSLAIDFFSTHEIDPYFMDSRYMSTTELYLLSTTLLHDSYTLGLLETDSPVDLITSLTDSSVDIDLPNSLAIDFFSTHEIDPYFMDSRYMSTTELYLLSTTEITPQNTLNIDNIYTSEIDPQCATDTDTPKSLETVSENTTEIISSNVNIEMFSTQTTAELYSENGGITSVLSTTELSAPSFTQVPNTTLLMSSADPKTLPQIATSAQTFTATTSAITKLNPIITASTTITTASTTTTAIPTTTAVTSIPTNTTPKKITTTNTTLAATTPKTQTSSKTNETQTTTTQRATTSTTTTPASTPTTITSTKSNQTATTRTTTPTTKSATTTTPKTTTSIPTSAIPTTATSVTTTATSVTTTATSIAPTIKSIPTTPTPTTATTTTPTTTSTSTPTTTTPKTTTLPSTTATVTKATPTNPTSSSTITTPTTTTLMTATSVPTTTSLKTTTSTPKATSSIPTTTIPTTTTATKPTTTLTKTTLTQTTRTQTTAKSTTTTTTLTTTSITSNPTTPTSAPSTLVHTNQPSTTSLTTQPHTTPTPSTISTLTSPQPETTRSTEPTNISPPVAYTAALFCQPLGTANQTMVIAELYWDVTSIPSGITLYLDDKEMIQCNVTSNKCTKTNLKAYPVNVSFSEIFNWKLGFAISLDVGFPKVETLNFSIVTTAGGRVQNASCSSVYSEPVNECVTQPDVCGHGGQCQDATLGFTCNCGNGYQGHTCSQGNNGVYCAVGHLKLQAPYDGLGGVCYRSSTAINCTIAGPAWNSSANYSATLLYWEHVDPATDLTASVNGPHFDYQLCITPDSLPGINEAVYNITSPAASFGFTFTLTLDIQFNNTRPRFNRDKYTVTITSYTGVLVYVNKSSTDTCLNSPCIEVIDPDKNAKLGVSSLKLSVVRNTSGSSKIFFLNNDSPDSFGYFDFLGAPLENETFQLTAVDGQNASAQAEVKFEVNYPPVCPTSLSLDPLDMLANGIIATLNCTNPEVGVYLHDTSYNVSSNMEAYFAVSSNGSINVIKPLTSLAIGLHNFTITADGKIIDTRGSYLTAFSAEVPVSFNLTAPTPDCLLTDLAIPLIWKPSDIFKVNLFCQNFGIDSLAIKSVTFSDGTVFNASKLEKSGNDSYIIDIYLLQYKAGTYNCWVTATYGSEPSTTNMTIVVPVSPFQQIHDLTIFVYTNASVGEMLWNISKELNLPLPFWSIKVKEFPLIGLLDVNDTTGIITLDSEPKYYGIGNYTLVLRIEINTSSYVEVNVTVRIVDVNEPPSCTLTYNNISVNDVNIEIGYLNCTDPDTTDEYRNLDYSIEAAPSLPVNISNTGQIHLVGPVPPGISTALVTAAVTDGTFRLPFTFHLYIFSCELTYSTQRPLYWTRSTNVLLNLHCETYNNGILKIYSNTTSPKQVFRVSEVYSNSTDVQLNLTQMEYHPDDYTFSVYVIINGVTVNTSLLIRISNATTIMGRNSTILQNHDVTKPVFYISVTVNNSSPLLTFTIMGDQHNLFKINQDEKSVYLNRTLSNDDVGIHEFNISVTDHSTSLTVWATFFVTVEDVNEAPTCMPPKVLVPLLSDQDLYTEIAEINCTDPDRADPFKSLNYMISTVPSSILSITEYTGIVFLAIELKYTNLSNTTIYATVNVTSIDLSVLLTFNLTINAACQAEIRDGVHFNKTFVGGSFVANCPANYTGSVVRSCNQGAIWEPFVLSNCTRASLSEAISAAGQLANSSLSAEEITQKVEFIVASLNISFATNSTLISGDIKNVLGIFNSIGGALNKPGAVVRKATLEMFADISSTLVETKGQVWSELRDDNVDQTAVLLYSLERITATSLRTLDEGKTLINRSSVAIALYTGAEEINFPQTPEMLKWGNQIFLPKDALIDKVNYSVILYKQLADKIQINTENQKNYSQGIELLSKKMNSDIMSISIPNNTISQPVELTMLLNQKNLTRPSCAFLNTTISNPEVGVWSTGGCEVKSFNSTHVVCSCDHLTNFAVLMSQYASSEDSLALSIISAIGCAISLFCLVITIIVYIVVWKYVKNDRSVLHVNLCVCLIAGYIIFLAGVDRTDDPAGCTVVAALLHFFFLAVFFIMLGEGIEIMKSVIVVFTSRSILVYLLAVAYGVPLVIVAISLGVTKTEGYGNEMSCWLSVDSGLIWAFIGPVLFVFVANLIILIVVIRAIQTSQIMRDKSTKQKVKSVARSICVLSPILGITWIFGVLSVSKETVVFQYLFAIFNSLQGLFIFIFQCFLQHQVRDGVKALRRKYYAVTLDSKKSSSNTNRYSESNSNTASRSKNVSSGSTQSTYDVGSPVTDHKPNFNQIKNPAFHETLEIKRSNKSAQSISEKSERSASSNDSRRPFDKFDESHEDHFVYLRGGSYYGDINPNFVQIPGYSVENNKVNHDQIDSDQNQDKFGSTKKETWHLVSRKRKSGQEENPEIEKERLKQIYGKVNAVTGLQNNENLTANQIKARERWKKVQNFTKSPERSFTKAELFGARMANTEDFTLSPNGSVSSSSKKSSKTNKRPNLTPLIIPRPMTFPLPEPDYHSSI